MILVTGAAGKTGRAILRTLVEKGKMVNALVFRPEQIQGVEALGANEVFVGDLGEAKFIKQALKGATAVYHICPNVHPDEIAIGQGIINAAVAHGIKHFVYHSVLHPQIEAMPHHWKKMRVEERLFESGLPYTILQPSVYMQNILANWNNIVETGRYTVPYNVESPISMVDLEDVAQVAAMVLKDADHEEDQPHYNGATFELVGTEAISQEEVAGVLSQRLDRPVVAERVSISAWESAARNSGLGDYQVNTLIKMFEYYDIHGFWGSSNTLRWLLNREPTSFEAFVRRTVDTHLQLRQ